MTDKDQDEQKKQQQQQRAFQPPIQQGRPLPEAFTGDVGGGVTGLPQSTQQLGAPVSSLPQRTLPTAATPAPVNAMAMQQVGQGRPLTPAQPVSKSPGQIAAENEYTRLSQSQPGSRQIHNPILRTLATVGDVASSFFPAQSMLIPGTTLHHQMLVNQAHSAVNEQEKARQDEEKARMEAAQQTNLESLPELHEAQAEAAQLKGQLGQQKETELERRNRMDEALKARKDMQKIDPVTGQLTAISPEEMSPVERDAHEFKQSQMSLNDAKIALDKATAEYRDAQTKNEPEKMKLAAAKLATATQAHQIAQQNLELHKRQFNLRYYGQEEEGAPKPTGAIPPGTMLTGDEQNPTPVGTAFQTNVKPTNVMRNRGELATSAHQRLGEMQEIIRRRPDIFGPLGGRTTDFKTWVGSQDPDAQAFEVARQAVSHHMQGAFGGVSEPGAQRLEKTLASMKTNPEAAISGLQEADKIAQDFMKQGTVRTAGAAGTPPQGGPPRINTQAEYDKLPAGTVFIDAADGTQHRKK